LTAPGSRLDLVDRILSRNLSWVAAADTKIAPVLAIDTAMLGVLAALAPVGFQWTAVQAGVAAVAGVLLLASLGVPRVRGIPAAGWSKEFTSLFRRHRPVRP